jgi:hypothetical protein
MNVTKVASEKMDEGRVGTVFARLRALFAPSHTTLLSPLLDPLMAGGISIFVFLFCNFVLPDMHPSSNTFYAWSIAMYYAAFLVNYPHFMLSYQLLYHDGKADFFGFRTERFFALKLWWAGIIVPLIIFLCFLFALSSPTNRLMGYFASAMYFFVGWHYTKQIFGCMIVLSSVRKIFFSPLLRRTILTSLYALWAVSFIASNIGSATNMYYGIPYTAWNLPPLLFTIALIFFGGAASLMIALFVWRYYREHILPPLSALLAYIAIVLWFFPFYHFTSRVSSQYFFYVVPLFHSLQYLLFVLAYKRNETVFVEESPLTPSSEKEVRRDRSRLTYAGAFLYIIVPTLLISSTLLFGPLQSIDAWCRDVAERALAGGGTLIALVFASFAVGLFYFARRRRGVHARIVSFFHFFLSAYVLGFISFAFAPNLFDVLAHHKILPGIFSYDSRIFGPSLYLYFFLIAINVHHYFIDNVIWRRDNKRVRKFLVTE